MCSLWNPDSYHDEYCDVCHGSCCGSGMPDTDIINTIKLQEAQRLKETETNGPEEA